MKLSAIIFLLAILAGTFQYGIYEIMIIRAKIQSRYEIQMHENNNRFTVLTIPFKDERQYDHHEIWYQGKLYDLVKKEIKLNTMYLYLYNDQEEENIISTIEGFFKSDDNSLLTCSEKANCFSTTHKIEDQLFTNTASLPDLRLKPVSKRVFLDTPNSISIRETDVPTPPPK